MMANETWMGAAECKEKGFADEIVGGVAAALNGNTLVINAISHDLSRFGNADAVKNKFKQSEVRDMPSGKLEKILNALGLQELLEDTQAAASGAVQPQANNALPATAVDNVAAVEAAGGRRASACTRFGGAGRWTKCRDYCDHQRSQEKRQNC